MQADSPAAQYQRDGFFIVAEPIIPTDLIARTVERMDAVMAGEYETGIAPKSRHWNPGDDERAIRKIDLPHLSDRTILELFCYPTIGEWAARVTGAEVIQLWAAQMLYKPPSGNVLGNALGNVGWHQDKLYWPYWSGEVFTVWIALNDVSEENGAMRFVRRSHTWGGVIDGGDFFSGDHEAQREAIAMPSGEQWEEVAAELPAGGVSFHHGQTFHGSGPNVTTWPRRSFALHIRTEKSSPLPGVEDGGYASRLDEPDVCPILYQA
ncbi:MAG: phytanoyl-CoA dioxygenase family protein [Chloroflexota bacterium]